MDWRDSGKRKKGRPFKKIIVDANTGEVFEKVDNLYYKTLFEDEKTRIIEVHGRQTELFK